MKTEELQKKSANSNQNNNQSYGNTNSNNINYYVIEASKKALQFYKENNRNCLLNTNYKTSNSRRSYSEYAFIIISSIKTNTAMKRKIL